METEQFEKFEKSYKIFNGYISSNVDIKYFEKGGCKCTFAIPLKENKDSQPVFLNCEAWNKTAEKISETYKKGDEITIMGYFKESEYNGKKYTNFVVKLV